MCLANGFLRLSSRYCETTFPVVSQTDEWRCVAFDACRSSSFLHVDVGDFVHTFGDCHLYSNHLTDEIVFEQLKREPRALPTLKIKRKPASIFDYEYEDFEIEGYDPHGLIRAPIAI